MNPSTQSNQSSDSSRVTHKALDRPVRVTLYNEGAAGIARSEGNARPSFFMPPVPICDEKVAGTLEVEAGGQETSSPKVEVIFSRETLISEFLESLLGKAEVTVEAALHQIDNPRLAQALEKAWGRGVQVRLLLDRAKFEEGARALAILPNHRTRVRLLNGRLGPASRMHHKFALLDGRTAVTGSYNWTKGSDEQNFENLVILRGQQEVEAYRQEFAALWKEGRPLHSRRISAEVSGKETQHADSGKELAGPRATPRVFRLYLMRHGPSQKTSSAGKTESPLTPEGRKKVSEITRGLIRMGFELDWIVSSPLRSAIETAKLVVDRLQAEVALDCREALRPGGSVEDVVRILQECLAGQRVLVVGHEPALSRLAARLLDGGDDARLKLKKGGCCLLTFDDRPSQGKGRLAWWLPPRLLRRIR